MKSCKKKKSNKKDCRWTERLGGADWKKIKRNNERKKRWIQLEEETEEKEISKRWDCKKKKNKKKERERIKALKSCVPKETFPFITVSNGFYFPSFPFIYFPVGMNPHSPSTKEDICNLNCISSTETNRKVSCTQLIVMSSPPHGVQNRPLR